MFLPQCLKTGEERKKQQRLESRRKSHTAEYMLSRGGTPREHGIVLRLNRVAKTPMGVIKRKSRDKVILHRCSVHSGPADWTQPSGLIVGFGVILSPLFGLRFLGVHKIIIQWTPAS